jgi:hypothetical protein
MRRHRKLIPVEGKASARVDVLVVPVPAPDRARELNTLKSLDLTEFNARAEEEFVKLVGQFVIERGSNLPRVREVLAEAAFELNISVETAKRYLLKHTASRAEFAILDGRVAVREHAKKYQEQDGEA